MRGPRERVEDMLQAIESIERCGRGPLLASYRTPTEYAIMPATVGNRVGPSLLSIIAAPALPVVGDLAHVPADAARPSGKSPRMHGVWQVDSRNADGTPGMGRDKS